MFHLQTQAPAEEDTPLFFLILFLSASLYNIPEVTNNSWNHPPQKSPFIMIGNQRSDLTKILFGIRIYPHRVWIYLLLLL